MGTTISETAGDSGNLGNKYTIGGFFTVENVHIWTSYGNTIQITENPPLSEIREIFNLIYKRPPIFNSFN